MTNIPIFKNIFSFKAVEMSSFSTFFMLFSSAAIHSSHSNLSPVFT